jgi:hypothetical protein
MPDLLVQEKNQRGAKTQGGDDRVPGTSRHR